MTLIARTASKLQAAQAELEAIIGRQSGPEGQVQIQAADTTQPQEVGEHSPGRPVSCFAWSEMCLSVSAAGQHDPACRGCFWACGRAGLQCWSICPRQAMILYFAD